jgi:ABC-type nitrate/sulfonate/bicarbonate transport system substrate-binding protein
MTIMPIKQTRRTVLAGAGSLIAAPSVLRAQSLTEFKLPISSTSFATAPLRAAAILGSFARQGLDVRLPFLETGANLTAALVSGSAKVILGGAGEQVAAWTRGQPILVLTKVYWGLAGSLILSAETAAKTGVSPTAPIAARLKALDGLLIAGPSPTSTYSNAYKGGAESVGAKIRFTYMAQPAMVAGLEAGSIQGYIAGGPLWGAQVARGKAVLWLSAPKGELPPANVPASTTSLQVMRPFAEANGPLMKQVLNGYKDFSDILEKTPGKVREAFAQIYKEIDSKTMDVMFEAEKGAWLMKPVTAKTMQQEIDFMKASGTKLEGIDKLDPAAMIYVQK